MRALTTILVLCLSATIAGGGVVVPSPAYGWLDEEEFRWDATAGSWDFSDDTWTFGDSAGMTEGDSAAQFRLDEDQPEIVLKNPVIPFAGMHIRPKGRPGDFDAYKSSLNATLDARDPIFSKDDLPPGQEVAGFIRYVHINDDDGELSDMDFALQRVLYIDWSGTPPAKGAVGIYKRMSQIPEPVSITLIIMVTGLGLFVRRRFRA